MDESLPATPVLYRMGNLFDFDGVQALVRANERFLGQPMPIVIRTALTHNEVVVAQHGGKVLGFVQFHVRRDMTCTVYKFATDRTRRREGIGRGMLGFLVEHVREKGATAVCLKVMAGTKAVYFYKRCGFAEVGTEPSVSKSQRLVLKIMRLDVP